MGTDKHSAWTIIATACVAFVIADMSHEILGHGVTAYLLGAQHLSLSSTYLSSDIRSRLVQAAGTLVNLLEGALAWFLLRKNWGSVAWRYFLWLLIAFNLLSGTGYFLFSAISNSGDWAEVVRDLPHAAALRLAMGLAGATAYVLAAYVCARLLTPFSEKLEDLTLMPYWTVLVVNCAAAALNPLGLKYVLISALPTAAGANAALILIPWWTRQFKQGSDSNLLVPHNISLVVAGAIVTAIFIFVIGPGINWNR